MSKRTIHKIEPAVANGAVAATSGEDTAVQGRTPSARGGGGDVETARLAYSYWEARGRSDGSAVEDWVRAELERKALRL